MRTLTIAITLILLLPAIAAGHGVFWEEAPHGLVLMEGHPYGQGHGGQGQGGQGQGGQANAGEDPAPLPVSRLQVLLRADADPADGAALAWTEVPASTPIVAPTDAAVVLAVLDWGWWTKTVDGTRNVPPAGVEGVLQAWCSRETVKHVTRWAAGADRPAGRGLELTPLSDPLRLEAGDKLTLLVTLDGEPLAGAAVTYDGSLRGDSGKDGRIRLKLRHGGLQVVRATLRRPAADPDWAEDVQTATLTFTPGGGR